MKQNVNFYAFQDAFTQCGRGNNFSYDGLKALFEYLEEVEESTGDEIELDVIALCCEYSELTDSEFRESYPDREPSECDHLIAELDNGNWLIANF